jgi:exopolysaccharide biosynthesis polyprenyl glycosylphosphotransferase
VSTSERRQAETERVAALAAAATTAQHDPVRAPRRRLRVLRQRPDVELGFLRTGALPEPARYRDTLYRRALGAADIMAAAVALVLAIVVFGGDAMKPFLIAAVPLVLLVGKIIGLYDRDQHLLHKTTLEEAPALFQLATLYTLLIWLFEAKLVRETVASTAGHPLGREQVVGLWAGLFICLLGGRAIARGLVRDVTPPERCLVLGSSASARQVSRKFESARAIDATVVGRVPLDSGDGTGDGPGAVGDLRQLPELIEQHQVERVIIAPSASESDHLLDSIRLVKALGVKVSVLPRFFEVVGSSVAFDDVEGLLLLGVPQWGLTKSSRFLKRSVDLIGSGLALFLLAPLVAAIAVAVKLTSPGPIFFRQPRIGRDGREFSMVKFRTMYDGADEAKADLLELNEADGLFKIANDPRLTRVGRVLRRFSFDELPQLFNVLAGRMSLVGPRPLVADDDERIEGWNRQRLDVPPGMTGIWQVLGSSRVPLHEMVKIDYLYAANWSIWLDLKILLRTIPHVLGRRGL